MPRDLSGVDITLSVDAIIAECDHDGDGKLSAPELLAARLLARDVHDARELAANRAQSVAVQFAASEFRAFIKHVGPGVVSVDPHAATKV